MLKRVKIALWISLPIAVLVVGILSIQHNMDKPVQKLNVDIDYRENGSTNRFLTYEDVNTFIAHRYDSIVGKPVDKVNIEQMEKDLMVIPYIKWMPIPLWMQPSNYELYNEGPLFAFLMYLVINSIWMMKHDCYPSALRFQPVYLYVMAISKVLGFIPKTTNQLSGTALYNIQF
jgi:hypothetical protein